VGATMKAESFHPTVVKMHMGNEQCYFVPYNDLCKALRIPEGYWLSSMHDYGTTVELKLTPKKYLTCKKGIVKKDIKSVAYTLRDKQYFIEQLGIDYELFDAMIYARIDTESLKWIIDFPTPNTILDPKTLVMCFGANRLWNMDGGGIFIPDKTFLRRKY
jgi:hypothetical protein